MSSPVRTAEKIRALLDQAEHPSTGVKEAEAFTAKAQEIMTRYAIDEAMVRGTSRAEANRIITITIDTGGIYGQAKRHITNVIGNANGAKSVIRDLKGKPPVWRTMVTGYEKDLDRIVMLDASVQMQCATALKKWAVGNADLLASRRPFDRFKDRRTFVIGFAGGLRQQLEDAKRRAMEADAAERASASGNSAMAEQAGVELVLLDKATSVQNAFDTQYGDRLRKSRSRLLSGSASARQAGHTAGKNARTGDITGISKNGRMHLN